MHQSLSGELITILYKLDLGFLHSIYKLNAGIGIRYKINEK